MYERYRNENAAERIYILVHPSWPNYAKIGKTIKNPKRRLTVFNTGCPRRAYRYAALVEVENAANTEVALHRALAPRRAWGEWYRVHPKLAVALAERFQKGDSPT
jgi:hypothetical protein